MNQELTRRNVGPSKRKSRVLTRLRCGLAQIVVSPHSLRWSDYPALPGHLAVNRRPTLTSFQHPRLTRVDRLILGASGPEFSSDVGYKLRLLFTGGILQS